MAKGSPESVAFRCLRATDIFVTPYCRPRSGPPGNRTTASGSPLRSARLRSTEASVGGIVQLGRKDRLGRRVRSRARFTAGQSALFHNPHTWEARERIIFRRCFATSVLCYDDVGAGWGYLMDRYFHTRESNRLTRGNVH